MKAEMVDKNPKDGGEDDYEAKHAAEDIMRAESHKANAHLMKRVHKHLKRKKKQVISSLDQLREIAKKKTQPLMSDDDNDGDEDGGM